MLRLCTVFFFLIYYSRSSKLSGNMFGIEPEQKMKRDKIEAFENKN